MQPFIMSSSNAGKALRDDTRNGCEGEKFRGRHALFHPKYVQNGSLRQGNEQNGIIAVQSKV